MVHDNVRQEMRAVLADTLPCPFIDQGAQELLDEAARKTFVSLGLGKPPPNLNAHYELAEDLALS